MAPPKRRKLRTPKVNQPSPNQPKLIKDPPKQRSQSRSTSKNAGQSSTGTTPRTTRSVAAVNATVAQPNRRTRLRIRYVPQQQDNPTHAKSLGNQSTVIGQTQQANQRSRSLHNPDTSNDEGSPSNDTLSNQNVPSTSKVLTIRDLLDLRKRPSQAQGSETVDDNNTSGTDQTNQDDTEEPEQIAPPKQRVEFEYEQRFNSKEEFDSFLREEGCWSYRSGQQLKRGYKIKYRCNILKAKGERCDAECYSLQIDQYDDEKGEDDPNDGANPNDGINDIYLFYRKRAEHTCADSGNKISEEIKKRIIDLFQKKKTPMMICNNLRNDEAIPLDQQPTHRQVVSTIEAYKHSVYSEGPLTMRQLEEFVRLHTELPQDEHKAFIVAFDRSPSNQKESYFRVFVSTPRLLRNAAGIDVIHADATQKITTERYPLLVVGFTDMSRKFHLIGISISSDETALAYEFAFKSTRFGVEKVSETNYNPSYLVGDADPAILLGFEKVFGATGKIKIMCYPHVVANLVRKYKFNDTTKNKDEIRADLKILHLCPDEETFDKGCKLYASKWKGREPDIVKKLEKSFFSRNKNWFIGCCPRIPKTNNALERCNGTIQLFQTEHKVKPLKQFLHDSLLIVQQRSKAYTIQKIEIRRNLLIPDELMQKGLEYKTPFVAREVERYSSIICFVA